MQDEADKGSKGSKGSKVQALLDDLDRMRQAGWRWREMSGWVRERIGDPAMSGAAIRQLASRARRRQRREGLQK